MKDYIIIYHKTESDDWHITKADNPKTALLDFYEYCGGSKVLSKDELKKFADNFDFEKLVKLFEKDHWYKIAYIGEFNPLYIEE